MNRSIKSHRVVLPPPDGWLCRNQWAHFACIIAFTTQFIDRFVYRVYYSSDKSLDGFVTFTLSYMDASRFDSTRQDLCRYTGYREPPSSPDKYAYTSVHYHVLAAKFIFVFIFETVTVLLTSLTASLINDVPAEVTQEIHREQAMTNEAIIQAELAQSGKKRHFRRGMNIQVLRDAISQAAQVDEKSKSSKLTSDQDHHRNDQDDIGFGAMPWSYVSFEKPSDIGFSGPQSGQSDWDEGYPHLGFKS